jgi:hypothetical protein
LPSVETSELFVAGDRMSLAVDFGSADHRLRRLPQLDVGAERTAAAPLLDEYALARRLADVQSLQGRLGDAGLAGIVARHGTRAGHVPRDEDDRDDDEPADHDRLSVPHAPGGNAFYEPAARVRMRRRPGFWQG